MPEPTTRFPTLTLLRSCARGHTRLLTTVFCIMLLVNVSEMAIPLCIRLFVDGIQGQTPTFWIWKVHWLDDTNPYLWVPLLLLAAALIRWPLNYLRAMTQAQLGQAVLKRLRQRIYHTIQALSFRYHDRSHSGTLISNLVEDVRFATLFFENGAPALTESLLFIPVVYTVMFAVCWQAALVSAGALLAVVTIILIVYHFTRPIYSRSKELYAHTVQAFSEDMEGQLVVRAYGQHEQQYQKYKSVVTKHQNTVLTEIQLSFFKGQLTAWATMIGMPFVLYTAWITHKETNPTTIAGILLLIFTLQQALIGKMRILGRGLDLAIRLQITAERLYTLFDDSGFLEYGDIDGDQSIPDGPLELRSVSFSYKENHRALSDISLTIAPGEVVGLVGSMGAGKTTLIHLLCRFYDPDEGELLLNGHDLRAYSAAGIRDQFAIVFQESFLFSASIKDNIRYGWPHVSDEDVERVAKIAQAHDFIMAMPEGYDTEVGEKGVSLSGGQRQRLAIARAILQQPRILVLDDCTSALDNTTERAILQHLAHDCSDMTTILISHRMSSIAQTEKVYVLDRGRLVESGSPAELNRAGTRLNTIMTGDEQHG